MTIVNVWPVSGISSKRRRLIECSRRLGSGGPSVVFDQGACRVLKLTCCAATHMLFEALERGAVPRQARRHLPRVLEAWGVCATDDDGWSYRGYVLERLYTAEDLAMERQSESGPLDAKTEVLLKQSQRRLDNEVKALRTVQKNLTRNEAPGWQNAVDIATALMDDKTIGTRQAFGFLRSFCHRKKAELDLRTPGNVLLGADYRLVLADPVTTIV